jgi:hypothetical protein
MKTFLPILVYGVFLYLVGAFVQANFNIACWPEKVRGFIAFSFIIVSAVYLLIKLDAKYLK